ncbi:antitermination protein [Serratia liquefaciens]|uniref:bacteriophage antitermination protein Q n=1 Tax=Serratia liquefaciens TaxID=614 RepID=UPI0010212EEE|nr:bacteriophage antitermination protein Q [Serratia liquefaciens]RYM66093.1 antitermination protein [Serratia liquefaciens]
MNEQQLEYVRINLRAALLDSSGGTKGQLEAFAEHPPADKERNPRKPVHVVALDDGRGGVRHVKAENSALYVLETRSRRRPMPPINDSEFAAAPWRRAVNLLSEHEQAWVRYCYGFDLTFKYQILICEAVWNEHKKKLPVDILTKTKKRIISLVWLAVQEVVAIRNNDTYKEYAGAALAQMMDINRSTWGRVYSRHWLELKIIVHELDEETLRRISDANGSHA